MGLVFSSQNWEESRNIRLSIRFFGKMFEKWELSLLVIPHHKKFSASVFVFTLPGYSSCSRSQVRKLCARDSCFEFISFSSSATSFQGSSS